MALESLGGLSNDIGATYEERQSGLQRVLQDVAIVAGGVAATIYFLEAYTGRLMTEQIAHKTDFDMRFMLVKKNYKNLTPNQVVDKMRENVARVAAYNKELVDELIKTGTDPKSKGYKKGSLILKMLQLASDGANTLSDSYANLAKVLTVGGTRIVSKDEILKTLAELNTLNGAEAMVEADYLEALASNIFKEIQENNSSSGFFELIEAQHRGKTPFRPTEVGGKGRMLSTLIGDPGLYLSSSFANAEGKVRDEIFEPMINQIRFHKVFDPSKVNLTSETKPLYEKLLNVLKDSPKGNLDATSILGGGQYRSLDPLNEKSINSTMGTLRDLFGFGGVELDPIFKRVQSDLLKNASSYKTHQIFRAMIDILAEAQGSQQPILAGLAARLRNKVEYPGFGRTSYARRSGAAAPTVSRFGLNFDYSEVNKILRAPLTQTKSWQEQAPDRFFAIDPKVLISNEFLGDRNVKFTTGSAESSYIGKADGDIRNKFIKKLGMLKQDVMVFDRADSEVQALFSGDVFDLDKALEVASRASDKISRSNFQDPQGLSLSEKLNEYVLGSQQPQTRTRNLTQISRQTGFAFFGAAPLDLTNEGDFTFELIGRNPQNENLTIFKGSLSSINSKLNDSGLTPDDIIQATLRKDGVMDPIFDFSFSKNQRQYFSSTPNMLRDLLIHKSREDLDNISFNVQNTPAAKQLSFDLGKEAADFAVIPLVAGKETRDANRKLAYLATDSTTSVRDQIRLAGEFVGGGEFFGLDTEFHTDTITGRRTYNEIGFGTGTLSNFKTKHIKIGSTTTNQEKAKQLILTANAMKGKTILTQTAVDLPVLIESAEALLELDLEEGISGNLRQNLINSIKEFQAAKHRNVDQTILLPLMGFEGSLSLDSIARSLNRSYTHQADQDVKFGVTLINERLDALKAGLIDASEAVGDLTNLEGRLYFSTKAGNPLYGKLFTVRGIQQFTGEGKFKLGVDILDPSSNATIGYQELDLPGARALRSFLDDSGDLPEDILERANLIASDRSRRLIAQINPFTKTVRDYGGVLNAVDRSLGRIKEQGYSLSTVFNDARGMVYDAISGIGGGRAGSELREIVNSTPRFGDSLGERVDRAGQAAKDYYRSFITSTDHFNKFDIENQDIDQLIENHPIYGPHRRVFLAEVQKAAGDQGFRDELLGAGDFYSSDLGRYLTSGVRQGALQGDAPLNQAEMALTFLKLYHDKTRNSFKTIPSLNPSFGVVGGFRSKVGITLDVAKSFNIGEKATELVTDVIANALKHDMGAAESFLKIQDPTKDDVAAYLAKSPVSLDFLYKREFSGQSLFDEIAQDGEISNGLLIDAKNARGAYSPETLKRNLRSLVDTLRNISNNIGVDTEDDLRSFNIIKETLPRALYDGAFPDEVRNFIKRQVSRTGVNFEKGLLKEGREAFEFVNNPRYKNIADKAAFSISEQEYNQYQAAVKNLVRGGSQVNAVFDPEAFEKRLFDQLQDKDSIIRKVLNRARVAEDYSSLASSTLNEISSARADAKGLIQSLLDHLTSDEVGLTHSDAILRMNDLFAEFQEQAFAQTTKAGASGDPDSPGVLNSTAATLAEILYAPRNEQEKKIKEVSKAIIENTPPAPDSSQAIKEAHRAATALNPADDPSFINSKKASIHSAVLNNFSKIVPPMLALGGVAALMAANDPNEPVFTQGEQSNRIGSSVAKASEMPGTPDGQRVWMGETTPFHLKISFKGFVRDKKEMEFLMRETYSAINQRMEVVDQDNSIQDQRAQNHNIKARDILRGNI